RADADPSLIQQLDCQFQLVDTVRINYKGFHKLTTGKLVKAMQSQINDQMTKLSTTVPAPCQASLAIEVLGKPDMGCYVDATFAKDRKDKAKETTLTKLLSWLSVRNFFMLSHIPPKIVLDYRQQCHFPQSLNYP